eukprot:UN4143
MHRCQRRRPVRVAYTSARHDKANAARRSKTNQNHWRASWHESVGAHPLRKQAPPLHRQAAGNVHRLSESFRKLLSRCADGSLDDVLKRSRLPKETFSF